MKKLRFITCLALTALGFSASAQTAPSNNDFILFNNSWNMSNNNYYLGLRHQNPYNNQVNLQYVRSLRNNRALRFSLGMQDVFYNGEYTQYSSNDTNFQTFSNYNTTMAKIGIGMEWRKMLHKDVMIIGGADVNLGAGRLDRYYGEYSYTNTYTTGTGSSSIGDGLAIHTGLTPFTGIRISWGRLALGYTVALPFQLNSAIGQNQTINDFNMRFQHQLSVGYRIFNRKR